MKKTLCLLFALVMIFSCMSVSAAEPISNEAALKTALETGGEYQLTADITLTEGVTVPADKTVTLDLAGFEITYNSTIQGEAMITNEGNLTINDSVGNGVINYNYTGAADPNYTKGNYTITNSGTLTVNGGKITIADLKGHAKYPINNNSYNSDAIVFINGGHLYNYNTYAIRQLCGSATYKNSVTITGGVVEGYNAIWMQNPGSETVNGTLSITGGEVRTTAAAYVNGTSELKDVGSRIYCSIVGEGGAWSADSAVSITGGTINENVKLAANAPANITIGKGATFNGRVETNSIWTTDTDAGFYMDGGAKVGMMRFLFAANVEDEITASGIMYIKGADTTEQVGDKATGTSAAFYGDIVGIPVGTTGTTYYAVAYVTTANGTTVWSAPLACSPNWLKQFTAYKGGNE